MDEQLFQHPNPLELASNLGIAYRCIDVNPADQCSGITPGLVFLSHKKTKSFYSGGVEVPEKDNPDCILIVDGNNESPATQAESSNGHQPTSDMAAYDDEYDNPDSIFAVNED